MDQQQKRSSGFVTVQPLEKGLSSMGPRYSIPTTVLQQCRQSNIIIQAPPSCPQDVNQTVQTPLESQPTCSAVIHKPVIDLSYSIKMIPKKKADYIVQKLHGVNKKFDSIDELKQAVDKACHGKVSVESIGYIEPGHGAKGKQRWLSCSRDLTDMYHVHQGKKEILLWCNTSDQAPRKRVHSPDTEKESEGEKPAKSSRYGKFTDKMAEVEAIEAKLREKHTDGMYTETQIRSWAHLIQMQKHSSYDEAPDKPFWRETQKSKNGRSTASLTLSSSEGSSSRDSPGKRINMRGKCMEQLMQLHKLFESSVITYEQYEEMKEDIMGEVQQL